MWRLAENRPLLELLPDGTTRQIRETLLARRGLKALHERASWLGIEVRVDPIPWGWGTTREAFRLRMRHARLGQIFDERRLFPHEMQQQMIRAHEQLDLLLRTTYPYNVRCHFSPMVSDHGR